VKAIFVFIYFN